MLPTPSPVSEAYLVHRWHVQQFHRLPLSHFPSPIIPNVTHGVVARIGMEIAAGEDTDHA